MNFWTNHFNCYFSVTKRGSQILKTIIPSTKISISENNVLAVISDQKLPVLQGGVVVGFEAHVISSQDYSPFGVTLSGRSWSEGYRYGFQNQETDKEMWDGAINYKYRVEDPRLGRFFSVDPLFKDYVYNSTYAFSENRVIDGVELEGAEFRSYLQAHIWGGVGGVQIEVASAAGLILAGAKISGSGGLFYDSKNNFAFSVSYGGFVDFFNSFGSGISKGGSPKESGSLELGWSLAQGQASEVYYWGFDNVIDVKGASTVTSVGVSWLDFVGLSGSAISVNGRIVGASIGGTIGIPGGTPVEISNYVSYTSIAAFNVQDVADTYNAYEGISSAMEKKGIIEYNVKLQSRKLSDGYTELYWEADYKDSKGNAKTEEVSTGVKYKEIGDGSAATEKVINSND